MSIRISRSRPAPADDNALLDLSGAQTILGAAAPGAPAQPVRAAADTLFGPRGVAIAAPDGPLFVADSGHHRVLGWRRIPDDDNCPADLVIGHASFRSEGRNSGAHAGAATFNVPTGIATGGQVLAVADAWNHRILLWHGLPQTSQRPADVVLGQSDFSATLPNRGRGFSGSDTLYWPYGVTIVDGGLFVADTGNRRVLIWNRIPPENGVPADLVLGQGGFGTRDENAGTDLGAAGMCWPHAIAVADGRLCVADAGNNRIMAWNKIPGSDGAPCDFVLGQKSFDTGLQNGGAHDPTACSLSMPFSLAASGKCIIVADTANSRLVAFHANALSMGAAASRLAGQYDFNDKGDNRWRPAARDSLCWPYGVATSGSMVAVADSGNNRCLLWRMR